LNEILERIRATADYQFGKGTGNVLFPKEVNVEFSRNTGRIRYIYLRNERLTTLRPTDGLFSLSIAGAKRILENVKKVRYVIIVQNAISKFIVEGGDVFAVHVLKADDEIRAKDEVIIVDENEKLLAVGRAVLCGGEM
jgi:predicted RNA-binding protein (TIGR00451 family)